MKWGRITIIVIGCLAVGSFLYWSWQDHKHILDHKELHKQHMQGDIIHDEHDEANMPGLVGVDTTQEEQVAMFELFQNHMALERDLEILPDGIRATTYTQDEELRAYLLSHVTDMLDRMEAGRNPEVIIQSGTLDQMFPIHDEIETQFEVTEQGVVVEQRSKNAKMVALLHKHAREIDDMVAEGMHAVHMRMMEEQAAH